MALPERVDDSTLGETHNHAELVVSASVPMLFQLPGSNSLEV